MQAHPDKTNVDPWDSAKIVKCSDIAEMYEKCKINETNSGTGLARSKCSGMLKLATDCYKLDAQYYMNVAKEELAETYYLDLYIDKQMKYANRQPVFKMKDRG